MGTELLDWMPKYLGGRFVPSAKLLIEKFGKSPNIEDLITDLESGIKSLNPDNMKDRIRRSLLVSGRWRLLEALREWFRETHLNPAPAYARFADTVVQSGDVVLTFNYDDSLERELKRAGKWDVSHGYGLPLGTDDQTSELPVLKLHGSINWLVSIFGGVTAGPTAVGSNLSLGRYPVIHKADLEYLGYKDFSGRTYPGGGAFPSLILPARTKEFFYETSFGLEWTAFWDTLWSQATDALKRADKLVLCGYSLLPVDERARDLLLRIPDRRTEVMVVSGSQSERIASDFRIAGFADVEFRNVYFEDWVQSSNIHSDDEYRKTS